MAIKASRQLDESELYAPDIDDDGALDVERFLIPPAPEGTDPYFQEVWDEVARLLNAGEEEEEDAVPLEMSANVTFYQQLREELRLAAKDDQGKWVTIGGEEEGGKKHVGGAPVLLDEQGRIVGGSVPASEHGKHVSKAFRKEEERLHPDDAKIDIEVAKLLKDDPEATNAAIAKKLKVDMIPHDPAYKALVKSADRVRESLGKRSDPNEQQRPRLREGHAYSHDISRKDLQKGDVVQLDPRGENISYAGLQGSKIISVGKKNVKIGREDRFGFHEYVVPKYHVAFVGREGKVHQVNEPDELQLSSSSWTKADEEKHPRDESGQFAEKEEGGGGTSKPDDEPDDKPADDLKFRILDHLKANGVQRMSDLRTALGHAKHNPYDPLKNPVHQAIKELRDDGKLQVHEPRFGEPSVILKEGPTTEAVAKDPEQPKVTEEQAKPNPEGKAASDLPEPELIPVTKSPDIIKGKEGVFYTRAPAGGAVSPVNGEHYKGGRWMPIHGMSEKKDPSRKTEKTEIPKEAEESLLQKKEGEGRSRPAKIDAAIAEERRLERERKELWGNIRRTPLGTMLELREDKGSQRWSPGLKNWRTYAETVGEDGMKQISEEMQSLLTPESVGATSDDDFKNYLEQLDFFTNNTTQYLPKKHLKEVPSTAKAHTYLSEALEHGKNLEDVYAIGRKLQAIHDKATGRDSESRKQLDSDARKSGFYPNRYPGTTVDGQRVKAGEGFVRKGEGGRYETFTVDQVADAISIIGQGPEETRLSTFTESEHPRDAKGEFTAKGSRESEASTAPAAEPTAETLPPRPRTLSDKGRAKVEDRYEKISAAQERRYEREDKIRTRNHDRDLARLLNAHARELERMEDAHDKALDTLTEVYQSQIDAIEGPDDNPEVVKKLAQLEANYEAMFDEEVARWKKAEDERIAQQKEEFEKWRLATDAFEAKEAEEIEKRRDAEREKLSLKYDRLLYPELYATEEGQ